MTKFGVKVTLTDLSDIENLKKNLTDKTRVVYFETPCNPTLKLLDIELIAKTAHAFNPDIRVIVDNTFCTPYLQRPLELGADVVVHSATKYLNGHGDVIAGIVVGKADFISQCRMFGLKDMTGAVLSPFDAFLMARGLKTLDIRMERHCANAQKVAAFFTSHPAVAKVYYPGLDTFPGHEIAAKQMKLPGGMISIELKADRAAVAAALNKLQLCTIAVSLADLPAAEDISVDGTTDEIRQLRKELQRVQDLLSRSYTKEELLRMQNDKLREIQEADTSIKMAELDLRKKQTEASDGSVYSQLDGVVKTVRSPGDAAANNEAVVEVSAGGGYYVTGTVSELQLDTVKVGQTVTISSRMNGSTCTGEIVEISTYPADNASSWGGGNPNVSYYPFKVFVSEDQQLQEGESVSISYQAVSDSDGNSLYLENMYVRTENGKSYVMVRGENGRLEQRWVQTGKVVWDSYTQIRGGLTQEDYVAFPYGRDVVSGAKTEESTVAVQYGG